MFSNCPAHSRVWELGPHSVLIVILVSSAFPWTAPQGSGWDPSGSAQSILILLLWWVAFPAGLGSESVLVWRLGCPVHPELQTSLCRVSKMLSSSRCPTKTRVCFPCEAPKAGALWGAELKNVPKPCTEPGALPKPSLLCHLLPVNVSNIGVVNVNTDYFQILGSFCNTEREGTIDKLFQFHYSYW